MVEQVEIFEQIIAFINSGKSFVVTGGAGSGKTELLKSILYKIKDKCPGKKIICITHTNVAVNEIKNRIDNIYDVSTIHSFCQKNISNYKKNIKEKLIEIFKVPTIEEYSKEKGYENNSYESYKKIYEKYWKKNWNINNEKTGKIVGKREFDKTPEEYINALNNDIEKLNRTIFEIISSKCDYNNIKYNQTRYDSIKNFSYGHDSLLLIFVSLLKSYPVFKKILKDKFDLIFIDEYQDTKKEIIESLLMSFCDSKHIIGLFGDHMQSIYNDGIGNVKKYIDDHSLEEIIKNDNYRCSKEVIDLLNCIRSDFKQKLALAKEQTESDRIGSVSIYYKLIDFIPKDNKDLYLSLIDDCIDLIDTEKKSKILLLSNQALAKKMKFENLYNIFSTGINDAKEEIEAEMKKMQWLDAVELYSFYMEEEYNHLIQKLKNNDYIITKYSDKQAINDVFLQISPKMTIKEVMKLLFDNCFLKSAESRNNEILFLTNFIEGHNKNEEYINFKKLYLEYNTYTKMNKIKAIDKENFYSFEKIKEEEEMYQKIKDENIEFSEIINYFKFLNEKERYITMHKTKGSSIDDVIVVMENFFWKQYNFDKLIENDDLSSVYENTKKLFYVSCSRTCKNLKILKLINKSDMKNMENYFKGYNLINIDTIKNKIKG